LLTASGLAALLAAYVGVDPAATPIVSAIPELLPMLIEVPMTARTFRPGLAIASRKAEYARAMPGR